MKLILCNDAKVRVIFSWLLFIPKKKVHHSIPAGKAELFPACLSCVSLADKQWCLVGKLESRCLQ